MSITDDQHLIVSSRWSKSDCVSNRTTESDCVIHGNRSPESDCVIHGNRSPESDCVSDGDFELENFPTSSTYRLAKKKQKKVLRLRDEDQLPTPLSCALGSGCLADLGGPTLVSWCGLHGVLCVWMAPPDRLLHHSLGHLSSYCCHHPSFSGTLV